MIRFNLKRKIKKANNGITLIALVITIIVLLILAGVTIATLTGDNGTLTKSNDAKEQTTIAEEEEAISLAYMACKANDYTKNVKSDEMQKELEKNQYEVQVTSSGDDLIVLFKNTKHRYKVNQKGEINQITDLNPEEKSKIIDMLDINIASTAGGDVVYIDTNIDTGEYSILNTENRNIITENGVKKAIEGYCFIDNEGKLYTWGENDDGVLGDGSTERYRYIPVCISDLDNDLKGKNIVNIYKYNGIIIAKDDKGKLYTWGENDGGVLGDGITEVSYDKYRNVPVCISDLDNDLKGKNIVDVYIDGYTVIAKDNEGKLYTWGNNEDGVLGDGITEVDYDKYRNVPVCISDLDNDLKGKSIVDIYMCYDRVIAKDSEGKLYTWGNNEYGVLGDGTTEVGYDKYRNVPVCISNLDNDLKNKNIVDVYNNEDSYTIIAKDSEGKLYTWGKNNNGQLGDGSTERYRYIPVCISDLDNDLKGKNIVEVYNDYSTVIVKDSEGKLYTWGKNEYGELGDGTTEVGFDKYRNVPVCISDLNNDLKDKDIVEIYKYGSTLIAKDSEGKLYTWGSNEYGILGEEITEEYINVPICISNLDNDLKGKNIVGVYSEIVMDSEGKIYTLGRMYNGEIEKPTCISDDKNSVFFNKRISRVKRIIISNITIVICFSDDGEIIYQYIVNPT